MAWKESNKVSERMKFVSRYLEGDSIAALCREFDISRKTGHKFIDRYKREGLRSLNDRSRRPHRSPLRTSAEVIELLVQKRATHPSWGAPKIKNYLTKKHPSLKVPVSSTIHIILDNHQFVRRRSKRSSFKSRGTNLGLADAANDLWCADFKGQFKMKNNIYCYPLTVTDQFSRYIIGIDALESTSQKPVKLAFEDLFKEHGLPDRIRTDNGVPFASTGILGLSELSLWWLKLGIGLERITPGEPQQNGRHERMHLTLKQSVNIENNILKQQDCLDGFKNIFNNERPHDGIEQKCPVEIYNPSLKKYPLYLPEAKYPNHDLELFVSKCGGITFNKKRIFISALFGHETVGVKQVEEGLWRVDFMGYILGYFDEESLKFSPQEQLLKADKLTEEITNV